jgi:SagB-type dehydrogenase family enzyme
MTLPKDILDRCERVFEHHQHSKYTYESVRVIPEPDAANQPNPFRTFPDLPRTALATNLLDVPIPTLSVLQSGTEFVPESQLNPPQNLKTLSTWLYLVDGVISKLQTHGRTEWLRTLPSNGLLYPCEMYVAAFGIEGLEPGLYHYCARDFTLQKMREGHATLSQIKRGRPDLEFLKNVPAAILVSTIFCRSAWRFRKRAYRYAMADAGHLVQNLCTVAAALGMQTRTRLRLNNNTMRELIGLSPETDFGEAESVQAMVVWADAVQHPLSPAPPGPVASMPPIPRKPLADEVVGHGSILAVHEDCVAPGVAVHEIRPPLTEANPFLPPTQFQSLSLVDESPGGLTVRQTLLKRKITQDFARQSISRDQFLIINRSAFRSGTYFPLLPQGQHVALVRPFWFVHDVSGMDNGIWYYHPPSDEWITYNSGELRIESQYLAVEQAACGNAAAVCFMTVDLTNLMLQAGPDTYRLAHVEAGIAAQRVQLAANALGLGCMTIGAYYDEEVRQFLGLGQTTWQVIYGLAIGVDIEDASEAPQIIAEFKDDWRD